MEESKMAKKKEDQIAPEVKKAESEKKYAKLPEKLHYDGQRWGRLSVSAGG